MARDLAIVLNSGSINSAVVTALAAQKYRPVMVYVDIAAGPARSKLAFDQQVAHFKAFRDHVVALPVLAEVSRAAPAMPAVDPRVTPQVAPRLVDLIPLVGIAMTLGVQYAAAAVYVGLRVGMTDELARATEWGQIWNEQLQLACGADLQLEMPLLELDPWQVVDLGSQVGAPLEMTWTCDDPNAAEPCGKCAGCQVREAAFTHAAKVDPVMKR